MCMQLVLLSDALPAVLSGALPVMFTALTVVLRVDKIAAWASQGLQG